MRGIRPALTPLLGRDEEIELLSAPLAACRAGRRAGRGADGRAGYRQVAHRPRARRADPRRAPHHVAPVSARRITPTARCFPSLASSNGPPGSSEAIPPRTSSPSLKLSLRRSGADADRVALLANLLSLPPSDRHGLPDLSPQKRKELTLAALLAQIESLAAQQPVFIIFEDAHWIDPTSLELLALAVERAPRLHVLLLITARPEFTPPWPGHAHVSTVPLTRLGQRDGAALIERVTGGKTLPEEVTERNSRPHRWRAAVYRRTDQDGTRNRALARAGAAIMCSTARCPRWRSRRH